MIAANTADYRAKVSPHAPPRPIVFVVDDDPSVRDSLETLIEVEGWQPVAFASAKEFLSRPPVAVPSCLVLDATLPNCSCLDVQRQVAAERPDMPVIFVTDRNDIPTTVQAMKAGAAEFFMKPVCDGILVSALRQSIARSAAALAVKAELEGLRARHERLSRREREVMTLVVSGRLNKQVAGELGISEITVKAHRGKVMRKMNAASFVDLVHMAARLCLGSATRGLDPTQVGRRSGDARLNESIAAKTVQLAKTVRRNAQEVAIFAP
jgi:FixJ family two-component response regulator